MICRSDRARRSIHSASRRRTRLSPGCTNTPTDQAGSTPRCSSSCYRAPTFRGPGGAVGGDRRREKDGSRQEDHRSGKVEERTKTGRGRFVLLNERALRAAVCEGLRRAAEAREGTDGEYAIVGPAQTVVPVLNELGIRRRPPYNCRHTYATICLMSGLNPAFIAQQLGHSVQMLLSTYARWLNSSSDWSELEKLKIGIKSVSTENPAA